MSHGAGGWGGGAVCVVSRACEDDVEFSYAFSVLDIRSLSYVYW